MNKTRIAQTAAGGIAAAVLFLAGRVTSPAVSTATISACPEYACVLVTVQSTAPTAINATATATVPVATPPAVTPTRVVEASPTAAPTIAAGQPNLFVNPGFNYDARHDPPGLYQDLGVHRAVAKYWSWFDCDGCLAPNQGTGPGTNPIGNRQQSPEFKPASFGGSSGREFVEGNSAQQFFCFSFACDAGVFQTVNVTPGATCTVTARVRSWSTDLDSLTSKLITEDDKANIHWYIRVQPYGSTDWKSAPLRSRAYGYADKIYDQYTPPEAPLQFTFKVPGDSTKVTVFFEMTTEWRFPTQNGYVDDASLKCDK